VEKEKCGYDHFHDNKMFGGLVDGYIAYGGKRQAILEIKTSHDREKWLDSEGNVTIVPPSYIMQAGLYAELSNLDTIVFAVGFLQDDDYDRPAFWVPTPENTVLIKMDKPDMTKPMADAEQWYHDYIEAGETPAWTDADAELVKWLKSYKPDNKKRR
ncbi:MAG: recombinase, partial [Candidatus Methanomethylophilus sp.]|nr:recombinase [Methanomethylophilus sp.]